MYPMYTAVMLIVVALGLICFTATRPGVPNWVLFPGEEWKTITPEEAGLHADGFKEWVNHQNPQFEKPTEGKSRKAAVSSSLEGDTYSTHGVIPISGIKAHRWERLLLEWRFSLPWTKGWSKERMTRL